ncbi:threonine synthase [Actinoplanes teichomyceticus]|uniref:Threonine synthase n=1 Tax=Actinoplanes teichomyceticus TaxID=1867 RepID=A0A561VIA7_ACTTI|nr:pyridoxal-phosphate dependent enzyme [Actinoplanes teichomyceticus]TWG11359.1 threonine synthase [Actinoplanes teichomyceticus]GIF15826.1 threonine synthase [Actinoplanes teichomyceticus]
MLTLKYRDLMRDAGAAGGGYRWCCIVCGRQSDELLRNRCASCDGAMDAIHDLARVTVHDSHDPLQRYAGLLPVRDPAALRWLGEGNTPCFHAEALGRRLGLDALYLKDETRNPTRSTKDRMASVALARYTELGVRELALASTGNSSTAYARAARLLSGFLLHIFVGRAFLSRLNYPDHPSVRTYVLDSDFVSAGNAAKRYAQASHVLFEGGFFNPSRREGLKLAYLEAYDEMPVAPRHVFQAVSSGMGLLGGYKGALEYQLLGRLPELPAFVGVQQDTCSPMAAAYADGSAVFSSRYTVPNPTGLAEAILRGDPTQAYPYINSICRGTGGRIMSVGTEEIRQARRLLLETEGLDACYASATALAGLIAMRRAGDVAPDAPVLVNLTGADRPRGLVPKAVQQVGDAPHEPQATR